MISKSLLNLVRLSALALGVVAGAPVFAASPDAAAEAAEGAGGSGLEGARPDDPRVAWFREAKYGMFIHWGIYSAAGGVWQGQPAPGLGEWIMRKANIPIPEYTRLAEQFNPTNFNADAWAQLAQDAGMRYMVITSKHHDGFAMFHSRVSAYNVYDATPWKRDPMQELATACAKRGIKLCFYYSHSADWHEPNAAGGNTLDFGNGPRDFDQYFESKAIPQVKELLSNYGPIGLLWFDWPGPVMTPERSQKLADVIHALQPATLINSRIGPKNPADFKDLKKVAWDIRSLGDNHVPPQTRPGVWETAATIINGSWGYRVRDREKARTPEDVCFELVDVVSKGGNLLLNVGPDGTGEIPPMSQACLRKVGAWLKVNGAAIYGAGPTAFGPEFGAYVPGGKPNKEGERPFTIDKAWRCTTKPGVYYIFLFQWPQGAFALDGVKAGVKKAYLLSDPRTALKVVQDGPSVRIVLPTQKPDPIAAVLAVEYSQAGTDPIAGAVEKDARVQANGKGWRLEKAAIADASLPRVLLVGDSILNGYMGGVIKALRGRANVDAWVNPYCQSEKFDGILADVLANGPYDVVHINLGLHGWQPGRIPPGQFEPLTKAFIEVIRRTCPKAKIIWASTTPILLKGHPALDAELNPIITAHNRMAAQVMSEEGVPVNDLYSLMVGRLELARGDQFHWKPEGSRILAEAVSSKILSALPTKD